MALTQRQKEVLDFLVGFETKHGYAPSFEEIAKGVKLTSLATVHRHISTLEKKGFIRRGYNQSRSIEIVQLPRPVREQVLERKVHELPLVGRIAAGRPLLFKASQNAESEVCGESTNHHACKKRERPPRTRCEAVGLTFRQAD